MACKYYYKGKELSYEEFAELLQNGLLQETLKRIEAGKPPVEPPKGKTPTTEGGETPAQKMRSVHRNLVERSAELTQEQKDLIKDSPASLYLVLPKEKVKEFAAKVIEEIGVESAVLEASKDNSSYAPVERMMILGAAMDYYAGLAKKARTEGEKAQFADAEVDANIKLKEIADKIGALGTDYGRAIGIIGDIYQLSNIGLVRKLERTVKEVNEYRNKEATKESKEAVKIVKDDAETVKMAANEMIKLDSEAAAGTKEYIAALEKEVSELRAEINKRSGAETGSKKNPLKIKRITSDDGYNAAIKRLMGKARSGLSPQDFKDLVYVGTYHIENGVTKFADWYGVMIKKFRGYKDSLPQIYKQSVQDAVGRGANPELFDGTENVSKFLTERNKQIVAEAKEILRQKIEEVRTQIAEKDQKTKQSTKPMQKDLEYERLEEELADLEELRDKYIPELPEKYDLEKTRERLKDRLTESIIKLNDEINGRVKEKKAKNPDFKGDSEIDLLRKIKKAKEDILKKASEPSLEEMQQRKAARDLANLTKKKAIAEFNNVMQNNPERAKTIAPLLAAKRVVTDAKKTLDTAETQTEKTYLQKLVDTVRNKAKEYYKQEGTKVPNNDFLAFAIANGKSDYKIWERTKEAVEKEIDFDQKLTAEDKQAIKDFLQEYTESIFDTLLTKKQKGDLVREALIKAGYKTQKNVHGKTVEVVDWNKVTQNAKTRKEAEEAIAKFVEDTSAFTREQAKNEINALLADFNDKFLEQKTKQVNAFLGKGGINALKQAVGSRKATKTEIEKLVDLNERGVLDAEKAKEALANQLGLKEISKEDYAELQNLLEIASDESVPPFKKREVEEKIQYIFEKNGANKLYKEHREFVSSNMLTSVFNQVQNIVGGYPVALTSLFKTMASTGYSGATKVFGRSVKEGIETAKTIIAKGAVGRGSAFSDVSLEKQGAPKTRFLEYGEGKFLGLKDLFVKGKVGNTEVMFNVNVLNGLYRQMKYVVRFLEGMDAIPSAVISGLKQYSLITRDLKLKNPEWDSKRVVQEAMDWMYEVDDAKLMNQAVSGLKRAGVENPTSYEVNRAFYEARERARNEKATEQFKKYLDSVKDMAIESLKLEGKDKPTEDEVRAEQYRMLGREVPRDYLGAGERQAQIETGKVNTVGITTLLQFPISYIQSGIKRGLDAKSAVTRYGSNVGDATFLQLFPFISSIGRWIELGLELTPYGAVKGAAYKAGAAYTKRFKTDTVMTPEEISDMGNHFMMRSVLGAGYTIGYMYAFSVLNDLFDDKEDKDKKFYELDAVKGTYQSRSFGKEKVNQAIQPSQSIQIGDINIPISLLSNMSVPLMIYKDVVEAKGEKENKDRNMLIVSASVFIASASDYWYKSFERNSALGKALFTGGNDNTAQRTGSLIGKAVGSNFIPFNRLQQEVAQLADPRSKESKQFMTNLVSQLSIMGAISDKKLSFDYRGRNYSYGDIFVNSADGIYRMFRKGKYGDEIDEYLGDIMFAATDAYRETRQEDNLKFQIQQADGSTRPMDLDEYYDFRKKTAEIFNDKITAIYNDVKKINPTANEEDNKKEQRDVVSKIWSQSKEQAFEFVKVKSGFAILPPKMPTEQEINKMIGTVPARLDIANKLMDINNKINEQLKNEKENIPNNKQ